MKKMISIVGVGVAFLVGCGGSDPSGESGEQSSSAINSAAGSVADPSTPDPFTGGDDDGPTTASPGKPTTASDGTPTAASPGKPTTGSIKKPTSSTGGVVTDPAPKRCGLDYCGGGEHCCKSSDASSAAARAFCVPLNVACVAVP